MELQLFHTIYPEILFPPIGLSIGGGCADSMQDGKENGSLDGEGEVPVFQKLFKDVFQPQLVPQPIEDQSGSDAQNFFCFQIACPVRLGDFEVRAELD